jgi:hypothetical protein
MFFNLFGPLLRPLCIRVEEGMEGEEKEVRRMIRLRRSNIVIKAISHFLIISF